MKKKKTILIVSIITIILLLIAGTTYAFFQYRQTGTDKQLVLGDIFIHYRETDKFINISNAMPQKLIADDFVIESSVLNPITSEQSLMELNELDKCVAFFKISAGQNALDDEQLVNACTDTEGEKEESIQFFILYLNHGILPESEVKYLIDNNIIIKNEEGYKLNEVITTQSLTSDINELTSCNIVLDVMQSYGAEFQDGETTENFCRGKGTLLGSTYNEMNIGPSENIYHYLLKQNAILPKSTLEATGLSHFEFTIDGKNTYTNKDIQYEIVLNNSEYTGSDKVTRTERIDNHFLKFALVEMNGESQELIFHNKSYEELKDTTIFTDSISSSDGEVDRTYRLYMWIGDEVVIGGGAATYDYDMETWNNKVYASVRVDVNANFIEKNLTEEYTPATDVASFKRLLNNEFQDNIIVDTDGTVYLSGSKEEINFNYVWYSGKLWRITAINSDGSMKLITENNLTTINWGNKSIIVDTDITSAYPTSWIREWLNEDFLDTLVNSENTIVTDYKWDSTPVNDPSSSSSLSIVSTIVENAVGSLNEYEYLKSYEKTGSLNGYLNIGYEWWLISPSDSGYLLSVTHEGERSFVGGFSVAHYGVRPSINLKSTIKFSDGNGTINDPYIIEGTEEDIITNSTLLNTRESGEYVKLENDQSNQLFRIVDTEIINSKLTTKLTITDYVKDTNDTDSDGDTTEVLTKYFSNSSNLWSEVDKTDTTYWRGYLNNTWIKEIDNTYDETTGVSSILEKGTYYLGYYPDGVSYKQTVCSTVDSNVSVRECIETGNVVSNKVTDDYVGLLRVGEMFASQTEFGYDVSKSIWLITPSDSSKIRVISPYMIFDTDPSLNSYTVRPSINLKSEIVIKSGSGTKLDPFVVGLPS